MFDFIILASNSQQFEGILAATTDVGVFFGTQFAGIVMDKFRKEGKFQWRPIFLVPGTIALVCILVFMVLFKG